MYAIKKEQTCGRGVEPTTDNANHRGSAAAEHDVRVLLLSAYSYDVILHTYDMYKVYSYSYIYMVKTIAYFCVILSYHRPTNLKTVHWGTARRYMFLALHYIEQKLLQSSFVRFSMAYRILEACMFC